MALAETTLSSAVAAADKEVKVASATSMAAGRYLSVGGEVMQATKGYVAASTTVPVARGLQGTAQVAHVSSERVVHGDGADWATYGAGAVSQFAPVGRPTRRVDYSATATLTAPAPGENLLVCLNSTAFTLTVGVPTKELDGCEITFIGAAGAAYVLSFTGGLGGAGAGYTTLTWNATGNLCFKVIAMNEVWNAVVAIPASGTVTSVTAGLA